MTASLRTGALSILREGRLQLLAVGTDADRQYKLIRATGRVDGHRGVHVVDFQDSAWTCTCPDVMYRGQPTCAHIHAMQLVTAFPDGAK